MIPWQAAYRAGCIVREVEERFAKEKGLSPAVMRGVARLPASLPVQLRHLWAKALKVPEIVALLDGFDPPAGTIDEIAQSSFWGGYLHQLIARQLPATFAERLRSLREAASLSREQLADAADISRESIRLYELGERSPTWDAVQSLAKALGVTTDAFRDK